MLNFALLEHHGMVVEELAIKFEFDTMLVHHLNDWTVEAYAFYSIFNLALHISHYLPNSEDLEVMLSSCCGLEWLSVLRCQLHDELKVDHPLPSLLYLSVEDSSLEHIVITFPSSLPNMWNLTLRTHFEPQKASVIFVAWIDESVYVSFNEALFTSPLTIGRSLIIRIPRNPHNHLKDVRVTGFEGSKGQLEFVVHLLENAPNMVVITVDTAYIAGQYGPWVNSNKEDDEYMTAVHWIARGHFEGKISPSSSLKLL
uniref:At1g61320/AtMIF1 LRR domain-containing protein n=1 Tax=Oryza punctata TaxID=4537 RepID=A0A0E0KQ72_ORYPU